MKSFRGIVDESASALYRGKNGGVDERHETRRVSLLLEFSSGRQGGKKKIIGEVSGQVGVATMVRKNEWGVTPFKKACQSSRNLVY